VTPEGNRRPIVPAAEASFSLICRAGTLLCALRASSVVETMRPLPIEALPGAPDFVIGSAIIRGQPLPVIELSRLLGAEIGTPGRLVVIRAASRLAALAVTELVGFRSLSGAIVATLPPLLSGAARSAVAQLGTLDRELMAVLDTASLIPDAVFTAIDRNMVAA
jgi:purine-binding chemotaxis protein CheW